MSVVNKHDVTLNILAANQEVGNEAQKVLVLGTLLAAGSATSGALIENISEDDFDTFFGARAEITQTLRAFKAINRENRVDAIPLDEAGAAVVATGTIAFGAGTAGADGTYIVSIGSGTLHSYTLDVSEGATITEIGDALDVLTLADANAPFTTSNAGGTVTVTASTKGTTGNGLTLKVDGTVDAVTVTITGMASGATDPVLTSVFDVVGDTRYQTIVWPGAWVTTVLETFLGARINVDNDVLDGVAILSVTDTYASLISTYTALNKQYLWVHGNQTVNIATHRGSALVELNDNISAEFAAIRALRLTPDVSIAQYTIAGVNGARDSFGGDAIRSLPYFNTPFNNLSAIDMAQEFTQVEQAALNTAGVFILGNNKARNGVVAGEVVTTYKTDAAGNPDVSFKYGNFEDTMSGVREYYFNNLKKRFGQTRLTEGEIQPRRNMANAQTIKGYCIKLYNDLAGEDYVLTQAGETALTYYKDNISVTLDLSARKATVTMITPIVTQLANIVGTIQIAFSTN